MKPIKLVMSAFGSYAKKEEVDFTIVNHGIFLITGDTGAGKTTIYDAITYALYDKTSGGKRDGNMMRSQYADLDTPTFVEFTFEYVGNRYTIIRNPEYQRESKRKKADGSSNVTNEQSKVSLVMPDGMEFIGKKAEVNKKIIEIIGLDAGQFSQVAMIAQGDFLKLLNASSDERKLIFSKIFNTKIYWKVAEELKQRYKNINGRLEDNKKEIHIAVSGIKSEDTMNEYAEPRIQEIIEHLEFIINRDIATEKEHQNQRIENEKILNEINESIMLSENLEKTQKNKLELEALKADFDRKSQQVLGAKRAEKVVVYEGRCIEKKNALEASRKKIQQYKFQIESGRDTLEKERIVIEEGKKYIEKVASLQELLAEENRRLGLLQQLEENVIKANKLHVTLQQCVDKVEKARQIYLDNCTQYEKAYDIFIEEQAGILAKNLLDGMPCPVCGSLDHPNPKHASLSTDNITQEYLNELKKDRDHAEKDRDAVVEEFQKVSSEYDGELLFIQREGEKVIEKGFVADECGFKSIMDNKLKSEESVSKHNLEYKEAKCKVEELETCQKKYDLLEKEMIKLKGAKENESVAAEKLEEEDRIAQLQFADALQVNEFAEEEAYQKSKAFITSIKKIETDITMYTQRVSENNGKLKLLETQVKGKRIVPMIELSDTRKSLLLEKVEIDKNINNIFSNIRQNRETRDTITILGENRSELKRQYELISTLYRTSNGTISGTAKVDFETYVLRQYFRQIVASANHRLLKMVDNQFKLVCRDLEDLKEQGSAGLDLDVYSFATNSFRDVKTLSGGESFMAALSMALGLADIIQASAGVIHLDTMFIDEGFGSLDDESREQAIRILNELAGTNRLVGIISHVTELKEQIDTKLVVTKGRMGSCVSWRC